LTPRNGGVTVIEIIIVCTIIGLIAAVTTVGTGAGIRNAKKSHCLQNLTAIGHGLELYMGDHDGYYPSAPWITRPGRRPEVEQFKASLLPYNVLDELFFSPSDPYAHQAVIGEFADHRLSSYSIGISVLFNGKFGSDGSFSFSPSQASNPSDLVVFMLDTFLIEDESTGKDRRWSPQGNTLTVLFADGHAKSIPVTLP